MEDTKTFPSFSSCAGTLEELAPATDYELAQAAGRGDMQAFAVLYEKYNRRVYSLCVRMTQNVATAEDLTEDIFIHLCGKIGSIRGESAFATWLHRLTANHVMMHFRKNGVRRERTSEDGEMPVEVVRGTANPWRMAILDHIALDSAIAQLPPGYRIVFILYDIEGCEHHEIAQIINCSIGTSKSQLHKARMKLRRLLREQA